MEPHILLSIQIHSIHLEHQDLVQPFTRLLGHHQKIQISSNLNLVYRDLMVFNVVTVMQSKATYPVSFSVIWPRHITKIIW